MSSTMNSPKSKDTTDFPVIVLSSEKDIQTGRNNYVEWVASAWADLTQTYGLVASVLDTQIAYEVGPVLQEHFMPPEEPDLPNYTSAQIQSLRLQAHTERNKEVRKLALDKPKLFAAILQRTSVASRLLIEADGDWIAAKAASDPNALAAIIRRTHFSHVDGATAMEAKDNIESNFNDLRQGPTQSIAVFKKEFDTQVRALEVAGGDPISPEQLALEFLKKLDQVRHGAMLVHLLNGRSAGGAFPSTANDAYIVAKDWRSASLRVADSRGIVASGAAFMLADDVRALAVSSSTSSSTRRSSGVVPSKKTSLPPKNNGQPTSRVRFASQTSAIDPVCRDELPRGKKAETRTCYRCGKVGHVAKDCSHVVLAAVGDEEDEESALYEAAFRDFDPACMMTRSATDPYERVLFAPNEVIFDCAASRSLFENTDLLRDIIPSNAPTVIGGVQKGAPGIRLDDEGVFRDLGTVGVAVGAAGNIISASQLIDTGRHYWYLPDTDEYLVRGTESDYVFSRRLKDDGTKSRFYTRDFSFVATVEGNLRRYTAREIKQMSKAEQLMQRLGHMTSAATIGIINSGVQNCPVSASDIRNKDAAKGVSAAGLLGKTKKMKSVSPGYVLAPRVTQVQQVLSIDIVFVKKIAFLLGVLTPLGLGIVEFLRDRSADSTETAVRIMLAKAASRSFDVLELRCDGKKVVGALAAALEQRGLRVSIAGPGQHVSVVERMAQTLKSRLRCHELALPFVMTHTLLVYCLKFCMSCINLQPSASSSDKVSPYEQFSGMKLDAKRDLRVAFGDYVLATPATTDNSMLPRAEPFIALGGKLNHTGSVWMLSLKTGKVVTRDQFVIQPMPEVVIAKLNEHAARQGYVRGADPTLEFPHILEEELNNSLLPDMIEIDGRPDAVSEIAEDVEVVDAHTNPEGSSSAKIQEARVAARASAEGFDDASSHQLPQASAPLCPGTHIDPHQAHPVRRGVRWSQRLSTKAMSEALLARDNENSARAIIRRSIVQRLDCKGAKDYAFKISITAALRDRGDEARSVIMAELQQMLDKKVWHGVRTNDLTTNERKAVIRSSMFLKDKFTASGVFDKIKARLVAGGDQQDKELYDNLSSPTASTTSVLAVAAIAAREGRSIMVMDIGGAFLNADITGTGIKVHMRLNKVLTSMLVILCPGHSQFVEEKGTSVVQLDKALYGCVEAAALWYTNLCATLVGMGFAPNPYDPCVFNKACIEGAQITAVIHVDDLFVSSVSDASLAEFESHTRKVYNEVRVCKGKVLDYIGMTFDYVIPGQVSITMENCERDILSDCGVWPMRHTPAAETLFDTREAPRVSEEETKFFRTFVAKMLYLAKRVRPECLAAVAFLTTRVHCVDIDDLAKLKRLLGYLRASQHRGIVLRIGDSMIIRAYIDASYGVHQSSGKSHTGCAIVIGDAGVIAARSSKQKIVTKSSTEAELVGLSDSVAQAIHLRNFITKQGYGEEPVVVYQDNLSCMALIKRGGPGSERSRHINIRHFWVAERVATGDVAIKHLGTELMFANALTKPVQGAQFERERRGLTNWD